MVKKRSRKSSKRSEYKSFHGRYNYEDIYTLKTDGMTWIELLELYPHTSERLLRYHTQKWALENDMVWPIPVINTYYYQLACYGMTRKDIARLAGLCTGTVELNIKRCERKFKRKVQYVLKSRGLKRNREC